MLQNNSGDRCQESTDREHTLGQGVNVAKNFHIFDDGRRMTANFVFVSHQLSLLI
jgi:hypothetical protein